jgi:hypothetical protein
LGNSNEKMQSEFSVETVFAFIPFVNLWAAYRIQKLRKFLLIFIPLNFALNFGVAIFIPSPYSIPIAAAIRTAAIKRDKICIWDRVKSI